MEFKVNCGIWGAMFGVPSIVADNFLKLATGGQIKVLLYLLRCSGKMCSAEDISSNTGVSPEEAEEAVLFWQQANVLSPQANSAPAPVPSLMEQSIQQTPSVMNTIPVQRVSEPAPNHKRSFSGQEIADIMKNSPDIRELFKVAENLLGILTPGQRDSIIWMYDHLGLKKEVIITLISYCISNEKNNTAYMDKIAISWSEKGIDSLSSAQDEIQKLNASKEYISKIMKIIEQPQSPTPKQKEKIEQWKKLNISIELIQYANEKTIEQGKKSNVINYINSILMNWHKSGFATVQDVKNAETDYRNKKTASKSSMNDTDVEEYESVINQFLH